MPAYLSEASKSYHQIKRVHPNNPIDKLEYYCSPVSNLEVQHRMKTRSYTNELLAQQSPPVLSSAASSSGGSVISSPSSYSNKLVNLIKSREFSQAGVNGKSLDRASQLVTSGSELDYMEGAFTETRKDQRRMKFEQKEIRKTSPDTNFSPIQSSGFSEGTLLGRTFTHHGAANGVLLGRRNLGGAIDSLKYHYNSSFDTLPKKEARKNDVPETDMTASDEPTSRQDRQVRLMPVAPNPAGHGRSRRRKITRLNRRMLNRPDGGGSLDGYSGSPYALSELFSQSEIPGFREIFASDSYLRKFCWIVAFLFMTVLSLNDMTELITEYYEYPITVDVRLKDSARLPFPAVTVCNLNVVRFSALCSNSRFELSSQMPSEMRDKLCGIQVEKKKQNSNQTTSDSDISDINNIGITTTTTTTSTTSTTTVAPALAPTVPVMAASSPATINGQTDGPPAQLAPQDYLATQFAAPNNLARDPLLQQERPSEATLPNHQPRHYLGRKSLRRLRRSHEFGRPFAPKKWALRVSGVHVGEQPRQTEHENHPEHSQRNKASQFNNLKLNNIMLNQPGSVSKPPAMNGPGGSPASLTAGQLPGNRQPPNQQIGQNNFNPISQIPMGGNGGSGAINNQQQQQYPANNLGAGKNQQMNAPVNFVPANSNEEFELTERQERELQENLTNWLAVMYQRDPLMTRSLGHQFDDMILRCTMKSINCTRQRSFENSFSPTEGNCFTFKSRIKRKFSSNQMTIHWDTYEEANLAGTNDGLELVLNLEKNEYISGSSQVGALVMIHHPSDLGYAASEATFIAPEFTTYIGLKMVNISRLPAPYPESCVDSWPAKFADTLTRNSTYSQQACLKICLQMTIQSHCNCQSAFLPIVELSGSQQQQQLQQQLDSIALSTTTAPPTTATSEPLDVISDPLITMTPPGSSFMHNAEKQARLADYRQLLMRPKLKPGQHFLQAAFNSNSSPAASVEGQQTKQPRIIICDTRKRATRQCVRDVNLRAADRVHSCECPAKCGVIRYDKTISMARWPTREDKVSFDRGKLDVNFQNLAKVIVYFQTMTCEEVQQQPVFNAAKLFSSLGGIMGMYVGFSFLSVFEIFEVMSRKFWHYLTLRYRGRRFS